MKTTVFFLLAAIALTGCKSKKDKYDYSKVESISLDAHHVDNTIRVYERDTVYIEKPFETKNVDFNKN